MRSRIRFISALSVAVILAGVLGYMALAGNQQTYATPGDAAVAGETYRLNGRVAEGAPLDAASRAQTAEGLRFRLLSRTDGSKGTDIVYRGRVPDTFKAGRDIIVSGTIENGVFVADRNSMIAQCPSKFEEKAKSEAATHPGTAAPGSS